MKRLASSAFLDTEEASSNANCECQEESTAAKDAFANDSYPDGPQIFEDLFRWPEEFFARLLEHLPNRSLESDLGQIRKVNVSTSFSGMGTPEIAMKMISEFLQHRKIWKCCPFNFFAACDCDSNGQKILLAEHCSGASHVFADVCSVVPPYVVDRLTEYLIKLQQTWKKSEDSDADRVLLENKFHKFARKILSSTQFAAQTFCLKCNGQCDRFPSPSAEHGTLNVEVGGSPCIPFVKGGQDWKTNEICFCFSLQPLKCFGHRCLWDSTTLVAQCVSGILLLAILRSTLRAAHSFA